ncbi:MAG: UDP-N-acetylmuramoyl-L-alanine--D-glutamate ligase [Candidatus Staskawiczbacteria bacterium]|jgi:UDP-N-acetylmuramoylalanine--D-glutamate ligase
MNSFKGKKILIMGLGLNGGGVGVAKFFCKQGAEVLVTDLKTEEQLIESIKQIKDLPAGRQVKYILGRHEEKDFLWADLIIKNPDVPSTSPYLKIARKNNIPIETDVSLFFKMTKAFKIGVTGTKGKSTTASLIFHILKNKNKNTFLVGNIGVSPLEILPKIKNNHYVVLELSSFELEDLNQSPNIAVVTNIMPDHLNRYASMTEYIESKKIIFKYQNNKDVLILNNDDKIVKNFSEDSKSRVVFYSKENKSKSINLDKIKLLGEHNLSNILASIEVAKILKISDKIIEKSLNSFKGVPNRQEFIREARGVKYFNDTTATMPDATITAVKTFLENFPDSRIILICGGQNKGLKYIEMAKIIRERVDEIIMLPGTASDKIKENIGHYTRIHDVNSMQTAVKKAKELTKKGDVVILSPGAASFNLFKNEFDRGKQFVDAVKNIK